MKTSGETTRAWSIVYVYRFSRLIGSVHGHSAEPIKITAREFNNPPINVLWALFPISMFWVINILNTNRINPSLDKGVPVLSTKVVVNQAFMLGVFIEQAFGAYLHAHKIPHQTGNARALLKLQVQFQLASLVGDITGLDGFRYASRRFAGNGAYFLFVLACPNPENVSSRNEPVGPMIPA